MSVGIGVFFAVAAASADPNPGKVLYGLDPCVLSGPNGQCFATPHTTVDGDGSLVHAPDPGVVGYDIFQPVEGDLYFDVNGTAAEIIYSAIDIFFTINFNAAGLTGFITTDITSRIDGAVGTVVGDQIQWTGAQENFVSNGTIDCEILLNGNPACEFFTDYVQGVNEFVEGCNTTVEPGCTSDPTPIVLPNFTFTGDGSALTNTGEFNINKVGENNLFLALEATYVPEPGMAIMLASGALLIFALDRRRARGLR
jgi:hypothetical protein